MRAMSRSADLSPGARHMVIRFWFIKVLASRFPRADHLSDSRR